MCVCDCLSGRVAGGGVDAGDRQWTGDAILGGIIITNVCTVSWPGHRAGKVKSKERRT